MARNPQLIKLWLDCFGANPNNQENAESIINRIAHSNDNNQAIGHLSSKHINVNDSQHKTKECAHISKFLDEYLVNYAVRHKFSVNDLNLQYINYGDSELLFTLTHRPTERKVLLHVKQPAKQTGTLKQDFNNLISLAKDNDRIIEPIEYYTDGKQELFVTPYINQARNISYNNNWGIFKPEPFYQFQPFTDKQQHIVNRCIIGNLVSLYNEQTQQGIGACQISNGDFVLNKGWEKLSPTINNTLDNMWLTTARRMINCTLDEYKNMLMQEFSQTNPQNNYYVNYRGMSNIDRQDIVAGINLGMKLLENKNHNPSF